MLVRKTADGFTVNLINGHVHRQYDPVPLNRLPLTSTQSRILAATIPLLPRGWVKPAIGWSRLHATPKRIVLALSA